MVEPVIVRKLMRVGGSMAVLLDPDFIRHNGLSEGQPLYVIADKRILYVTFDEKDAENIGKDIHGFVGSRLRQRATEERAGGAEE